MEETVMHLMKRGAITCTEDCTVREIAQIMVVNRIGYCVVVNEKHEVAGIISPRSILKAFGMDLDATKAKEILLPYTITITPRTPLSEAIELMNTNRRWFEMDGNEDIRILLAEEQTFLSRERTMHSYMQTGLAFSSVGLLIMKYLGGVLYFCAGLFFIIIGALLIIEAGKRYMRFRRAIATLREKEARLGYDTGIIR